MSFHEMSTNVGKVTIRTVLKYESQIHGGDMDGDCLISLTEQEAIDNHGLLARRVKRHEEGEQEDPINGQSVVAG